MSYYNKNYYRHNKKKKDYINEITVLILILKQILDNFKLVYFMRTYYVDVN